MSINTKFLSLFICSLIISFFIQISYSAAQNSHLVWSDEFDGTTIDRSKWSFITGIENSCHYTDRTENVRVQDGKLQIIVREESYLNSNYTSGRVRTRYNAYWRYGRIEARIKLPGASGLVPAFWMMPEDDIYGWWPRSGEMDIMEYPTHEANNIYGSLHTKLYGFLTGTPPKGGTVQVPDAESAFHTYAVEWSEDRIDFYVDDNNYYSYENDHSGYEKWPFDRPYHMIANIGVGGDWVGNPDENEIFPAMMEIDYIRVYQSLDDIGIIGADFVRPNSQGISYSVPQLDGANYSWTVSAGAQIVTGQNTHMITVDWGNVSSNIVSVKINMDNSSHIANFPVEVIHNLLLNPGFEKGIKYWGGNVGYPAKGSVDLEPPSVAHNSQSVKYKVDVLGTYPWDVQLRQSGFMLQQGKQYDGTFWAKADISGSPLTAVIVNDQTFSVYHSKSVTLTDSWEKYTFSFTATESVAGALHINMGYQTGSYYLDDIAFIMHPKAKNNVTFNVTVPPTTPDEDIIYIAGNFNFWDPGPAETGTDGLNHDLPLNPIGNNQWQVELPFSVNEIIEYKFTRGSWATVESNSQGEEISSRTLIVPGYDYTQDDAVAQWNDLENILTNGDFSDGESAWILTTFYPAQAVGSIQNGEFIISISNSGNYMWDINLKQINLPIEKGKTYHVSFDAYAAEPQQISALVGKNSDPWNVYSGDNKFILTTSKQTFIYSFTMNDPTDPVARLGFDLGLSTDDVYFDNIALFEEIEQTGIGHEYVESKMMPINFVLLQNYPNPFNPSTTISYQLPQQCLVELVIYNMAGQKITTLVSEYQLAGNYQYEWDAGDLASGVYFYRITAGQMFMQINKLVLLK